MFSSISIRLVVSKILNPETFSHVTLYLDAKDIKGMKIGKNKADYYSYKLKNQVFEHKLPLIVII